MNFGEITVCACGTMLSTATLKAKAEVDRINGVKLEQVSAKCPNCGAVAYREIKSKRVSCSANDPVVAAPEPVETPVQ